MDAWERDMDAWDKELEPWFKQLQGTLQGSSPAQVDVVVQARVETLADLIGLAEEATTRYDCANPQYNYNVNLRGLVAALHDLKQLNAMIGMTELKQGIVNHILYYLQGLHETPENPSQDYKHMVLTGPPGVGKTEVAKLLGRIFLSLGVLTNNVFKKATRGDLIGGYLGQTALKTTALVESCLGGVLFVDEAYSLWDPLREKQDAYAREAIDTLCEAMSHHRGNLMVIFAGYPKEIDAFLDANRGMESRFLWRYHIDAYTGAELYTIFLKMVHEAGWQSGVHVTWFSAREKKFTACGRDMEKLLTFSKVAHGRRLFSNPGHTEKRFLTEVDVEAGFQQWLANQKEEVKPTHQFYYV